MTLNVVQLHEDPTLINDIPNQLRNLADRLEAGEETADAVLVIVAGADNEWPTMHNWGGYLRNRELIGLLEIAKAHTFNVMSAPE
jgi:hypothetical protein